MKKDKCFRFDCPIWGPRKKSNAPDSGTPAHFILLAGSIALHRSEPARSTPSVES
ncbi:hypothetical protein K788_0001515 (plasmid) [Paraburkholderia caribensis MBA4]|uniref:Uncharacterized protein n=1 Tax=Paraburkholderia caribensis MBA4 TaxID=1323664 RepID=A0A0P0RMR8_9BURK|nr:hypothetical protein K788_0001515 [Paraburkholderia caribensis MBA4]